MPIENDIFVIKELLRELVDLHKGTDTEFKKIDTLKHDAKKPKAKPKVKVKVKVEPKKKVKVKIDKKGEVKVELKKKVKALTAEDVKKEARKLVDGFKTNRKGFDKAQKILRKFGAPSLEALMPEKYVDVVNAFRGAIKLFGG